MRNVKEILRLRFDGGLSHRAIGRSVGISASTVGDLLSRAHAAGVVWPLPPELDEAAMEARLYPPDPSGTRVLVPPDWSHVHRELRRKGVTLMLLWQEYKAAHPEDGYQYSRFCDLYQDFEKKVDVVMRQVHRAGEKAFVDWSGDGPVITNPTTGEERRAELFLAVLGASNYTYADVMPSQELRHWIQAHIHAYEYFGGVPALTVPDNTKTAVTEPCRYDPILQATYQEMAQHYDTAILPARSRKPRDKAKVEGAVLVAQRWILAALRNHRFFGLDQANEAVWQKLEELNDRPFQKLDGTRRVLLEMLDRPALRPLPSTRYEYAEWRRPRVNIDYHVEVEGHFYSVPYQLVHERVDARVTSMTVEVLYKGRRVHAHERAYGPGYTTVREHMPKAHQQYLEWTPSRILRWAADTGPNTVKVAEKIMALRAHPEQGYRACLGILRLGRRYGKERVEAACARAVALGAYGYRNIHSMLKSGMDRQPLPGMQPERQATGPIEHENIRGPGYYN